MPCLWILAYRSQERRKMTDKLLHEIRVFLNEVAQRDMYGSYRLIAYSLLDDIFEELEAEVEKNSHTS